MLLILDTKTSNLQSVANAFRRIGAEPEIGTGADAIMNAGAIVLPGVGAFHASMSALREAGAVEPLITRVTRDRVPLIGICLGMQLLADESEEHGTHSGLGLIPGRVVPLAPDRPGYRVPNFGWHDASAPRPVPPFDGGNGSATFYFAHSYYVECAEPTDVVATIEYSGRQVTVAMARGNVFGVQFHPEKSQDAGLDVLDNFLRYVRQSGHVI